MGTFAEISLQLSVRLSATANGSENNLVLQKQFYQRIHTHPPELWPVKQRTSMGTFQSIGQNIKRSTKYWPNLHHTAQVVLLKEDEDEPVSYRAMKLASKWHIPEEGQREVLRLRHEVGKNMYLRSQIPLP